MQFSIVIICLNGGDEMSSIVERTKHLKTLLEPILGEITAKNYFSYCGIFKDELMFGLYKDGQFYLKISPQHLEQALTHRGIKSLNDPRIAHSNKYYSLPEDVMRNLSQYVTWFKHSLIEIRTNKYTSYYNKRNKIRSLPNMTFKLERLLRKINIYTVEDLFNKGEITTFVELIKLGLDVNHITLFKLYGAIHHLFIYSIPDNLKRALLSEADEALYQHGMRRRFHK